MQITMNNGRLTQLFPGNGFLLNGHARNSVFLPVYMYLLLNRDRVVLEINIPVDVQSLALLRAQTGIEHCHYCRVHPVIRAEGFDVFPLLGGQNPFLRFLSFAGLRCLIPGRVRCDQLISLGGIE